MSGGDGVARRDTDEVRAKVHQQQHHSSSSNNWQQQQQQQQWQQQQLRTCSTGSITSLAGEKRCIN